VFPLDQGNRFFLRRNGRGLWKCYAGLVKYYTVSFRRHSPDYDFQTVQEWSFVEGGWGPGGSSDSSFFSGWPLFVPRTLFQVER
jgi:hypothetical protein